MCSLFATDVFVLDRDVMLRGYDHMIILGDDIVLASQVNGGDVLNAVQVDEQMGSTNGKSDTLAKCRGDQIFDLQEYDVKATPFQYPGENDFRDLSF